jgi:hypothetical protein
VLKRDYILCLQYECCGVENYNDMPKEILPDACCPATGACTKTQKNAYPVVSSYSIFYLHYTFKPVLGGHLWDKEKVTL